MNKKNLVLAGLMLAPTLLPSQQANAANCVSGQNYDASTTCDLPAGVTSVTIQAWGGGGYGKDDKGKARDGSGGGSFCGATFAVDLPGPTPLTLTVAPGIKGDKDSEHTSVTGGTIAGFTANGAKSNNKGGSTAGCTATGAVAWAGGSGGAKEGDAGAGGGGGGSATPTAVGGAGAAGAAGVGGTGGTGQGTGGSGGNTSAAGQPGNAPGGGAGGQGAGGATAAGAPGRVILTFTTPNPGVGGEHNCKFFGGCQ